MKKKLSYNPVLETKTLVEKLKHDLPHRLVIKQPGNTIQVARRRMTLKRVTFKINSKKNTIDIKNIWDDRFIMIFVFGIFWPILFTKKRKKANEEIQQEVEQLLESYHQ
ncbi:hypothetical protein [Olleya sp. R77988]|uniref:hypothetical protein n=1 Tax=Olleya sp. R77988 TaxID=3093875 RepID=UPI0037C4F869